MAKEQVRLSNPIGPVKIYMSQYFVRIELDNAQEHTHRFLVTLKTAQTLAISVGASPLAFFAGHHYLLVSSTSFHTPLTHPHLSSFPSVRKLRIWPTKLWSSIWKREVKLNGMFLLCHIPESHFVRVYSRQGMGDCKKRIEFLPAIKWRETFFPQCPDCQKICVKVLPSGDLMEATCVNFQLFSSI